MLYEIGLCIEARTVPMGENPERTKGTATPEQEQQEGASA